MPLTFQLPILPPAAFVQSLLSSVDSPVDGIVIIPTISRSTLIDAVRSCLQNSLNIITYISFNGSPPHELINMLPSSNCLRFTVIADQIDSTSHGRFLYSLLPHLGDMPIAFLHDDDMHAPYHMDHSIRLLSMHNKAKAIYSRAFYFSPDDPSSGNFFPDRSGSRYFAGSSHIVRRFYWNPVVTPTLVARASSFPPDLMHRIEMLGGLHDFWLAAYFSMSGYYYSSRLGLLRSCHAGQDSRSGVYTDFRLDRVRLEISRLLPAFPRFLYRAHCILRSFFKRMMDSFLRPIPPCE
jgi:hypothetical protein